MNEKMVVRIEDVRRRKERVKAAIAGVLAGFTIGFVYILVKVIWFVLSETENSFKEYVEKQSQCYAYQEAIEKLKPELLSGNLIVINYFNNLVDEFNQNHCPEIIFNSYYDNTNKQ